MSQLLTNKNKLQEALDILQNKGAGGGGQVEWSENENKIISREISGEYFNSNVKTIGEYAFYKCSSLTTASFPACTSIGSNAFRNCLSLTTASFPGCTTIGSYVFRECYNLKSLYLTNSKVCTLSNSNVFTSTPIGGYSKSAGTYGSIYVPASLVDAYKQATNWIYFSSRFVGI